MIHGKFLSSMDDISDVLRVRFAVFEDEMGFPPDGERDTADDMAIYALALNADGQPIGTGRLFIDEADRFMLGRFCVLKPCRGQGYGDFLLRMLLYRAEELHAPRVYVRALPTAEGFYAKYGFVRDAEPELYDGMESVLLRLEGPALLPPGHCGGQ